MGFHHRLPNLARADIQVAARRAAPVQPVPCDESALSDSCVMASEHQMVPRIQNKELLHCACKFMCLRFDIHSRPWEQGGNLSDCLCY